MLKNKRKKKYTKYTQVFCDRVRNDFKQLQRMQARYQEKALYPEIKFYAEIGLVNDIDLSYCDPFKRGESTEISGFYNAQKGYIEIYNFTREKPDQLKRIIRHECLHFILANCGLPYDDNDQLFIILAIKYDAFPYTISNSENKYILDMIEGAEP